MQRRRIVFLLSIELLVLVACAGSGEDSSGLAPFTAIVQADFPVELGAGFPVAQLTKSATGSAEIGQPAPNFAFAWEDGRGAELTSLRGRPVVLNFWATWCGPCRAEMPELVALHNGDQNVVVLEVNTQETLAAIRPFAEEFGMAMPVLMDESGDLRKVYGVRAMPTTLFIDAEGVIRARWAGLLTGEQLSQFVTQIQAN